MLLLLLRAIVALGFVASSLVGGNMLCCTLAEERLGPQRHVNSAIVTIVAPLAALLSLLVGSMAPTLFVTRAIATAFLVVGAYKSDDAHRDHIKLPLQAVPLYAAAEAVWWVVL
jgi:hypothetical protein